MSLPHGILFDLDDTIVAFDCVSLPVWTKVCEHHCAANSIGTPGELLEAIKAASKWYWDDAERHRIGRNNLAAARREIVRLAFDSLKLDLADLADQIADDYSRKRLEAMYLFPGAIETLRYFRGSGIKMALITNGEASLQREKIRRFGLESFFDAILIEGELGYGKPEIRVYREALQAIDEKPESAWIVGDNLEWEIAVPAQIGLYTVWHDWRGRGLPSNTKARPNRIIRNISELIPTAMQ